MSAPRKNFELINTAARAARDLGLLWTIKRVNSALRAITALCHQAQFRLEWSIRPNPEWFDHFIDRYARWHPLAWERGIFNLLAIKPGARVLELCCGDGFNTCHFYGIRAGQVLGVDRDPKAIDHARRYCAAPNVTYEVRDIVTQMPAGPYDNIVWDATIQAMSPSQVESILTGIYDRIQDTGILSGYTLITAERAGVCSFQSKEQLSALLKRHFKHVRILQTDYAARQNLYFYASGRAFDIG